jgi:GT2 family glycosyltransferase
VGPAVEIIVVDNNSTDGTDVLMKKYGDRIVYLRRSGNGGAVARSDGMRAARGEIVVTLDDDVHLLRDDELRRIIDFFDAHPAAAAVNFKIVDDRAHQLMPFHWYHPRPHERWAEETFETDYISEGAVAFRRAALEVAGYYPEDFFISHEGIDLALRLVNAGFAVFYTGGVAVVHKYSLLERASWRNAYYNTRNYIWLVVKYDPFPAVVWHLAYRLLTTLAFCLRSGHFLWYLRAVRDGFLGLPRQLRSRRPLTPDARRRLRDIRRLKPGFFYKLRNFFLRTRLMEEKQKVTSGQPR